MENYENKNFDGNGQFPNLDDAFQALNKGHCYNACAALKMNKNNCIDNRDKIIQKLINAVQYYFDEIMNYFAQKKVFYQEKVTCRVYRQSDYDCGKNIGYLNETLYFYGMHSKEQLVLENILKDGLEQFVDQFPNEYILTTIADLIYDSDFSFPEKFVGLLSDWKRLKYKWEENGFNKQHIWQQLIDVGMLKEGVYLEVNENKYFDDDLLPALYYSDNLVISDHKPETLCDVFENMTEGFLHGEIKWIDEKEIEIIPFEELIQLNIQNKCNKPNRIEYCYFEYMGKYYKSEFDYSDEYFIMVIQAFNPFLQLFKPSSAVYRLLTDQEPIMFFTANKEKFDALNEELKIPVVF